MAIVESNAPRTIDSPESAMCVFLAKRKDHAEKQAPQRSRVIQSKKPLTTDIMESSKISVQVAVNAVIKKVWDYYTNTKHIVKWNFADPGWHCPSVINDMKVGGIYKARMEAKDGSFGFDIKAVYDEIIPGERFVYTMIDGRQASVSLKRIGDKTKITVTFDAEMENSDEEQKEGWQAILNSFKGYTESN